MRVLKYSDLDPRKVKAAYQKVKAALERGDFRSADVAKLTAGRSGRLYRARLDLTNRLIFTFVRHGDEVCVLALEIILNHAYEKSRFLRGAATKARKPGRRSSRLSTCPCSRNSPIRSSGGPSTP